MAERDISKRRLLALPQDLAEALADYRAEKYYRTEAAAVRALIKIGLEKLRLPESERAPL